MDGPWSLFLLFYSPFSPHQNRNSSWKMTTTLSYGYSVNQSFFAEKRVMRKIQFALHEIPDLNKFFPQPTDIISNITYHAKPQIVHIVPKIHSFHWFQVQLLLYYESDQMKAIQSIIDFCCCCPFLPSRNCLQFSISLPIWFIVCNLALRCRW